MTLHFDEGDRNDSAWRNSWRAGLGLASQQMLARDDKAFMQQVLSTPCLDILQGAQGIWLETLAGKRIMDFHGNSVHQLGYGHPEIKQALKDSLDALPFCPRRFTNEPAIVLAEKFRALSQGLLTRTLLMPSGSAAVSAGLRLARLVTGRTKVVTWWGSFHGATFDNCALSGEPMFSNGAEHLHPGVLHMHPPSTSLSASPSASLFASSSLEERGSRRLGSDPSYLDFLARKDGDIGVFLAEPVRNVGVLIPPSGYWQEIRKICDKHGILLFFDEIPNGLGRIGEMFAYQFSQVEPDLVALGKGLGGGVFPQAALLCREQYAPPVDASLGHFTHEKSPLGASVALAVLHVLKRDQLCERAKVIGKIIANYFAQHPSACLGEVRVAGALVGLEIQDYQGFPDSANIRAEKILHACLAKGLSFKVGCGNVLTLSPPLIIDNSQLQIACEILWAAMENNNGNESE